MYVDENSKNDHPTQNGRLQSAKRALFYADLVQNGQKTAERRTEHAERRTASPDRGNHFGKIFKKSQNGAERRRTSLDAAIVASGNEDTAMGGSGENGGNGVKS